jgi:hypothetical protein
MRETLNKTSLHPACEEKLHRQLCEEMKHLVEVEKGEEGVDGRPNAGPAYRSVFAKDGFPSLRAGLESCWDIFRYFLFCILEFRNMI